MRYFLMLCVLITSTCFSQSNFIAGTIVTPSGDSVKGSIDDQLWRRSPTLVQFKEVSGSERSFSPKDIKAFVIDGNVVYESHKVSYDSSTENLRRVGRSSRPSLKEGTVFLKVIVKGKATLYRFIEENDRIHYFIGENGRVEELLNHSYMDGSYLKKNRRYIGQLTAAFQDCPAIKIRENLVYNERTLTKLFENYGKCTGSSVAVTKKEKTLVKFGVVATAARDQFGGYPSFDAAVGYGGGVFANIFLPGRVYRWSVYTELIYRKFGEQNASFTPWHYEYPTRMDISSLKVTALGRNHFSIGKLRSFFNVGLSYSGGIGDMGQTRLLEEQPFSARFISSVGGFGVILNHANKGPKLLVEARFEYGNGPGFYHGVEKHTSIGLNLGLQF